MNYPNFYLSFPPPCHFFFLLIQNVAECWALLKTMVDIPTLPQKAYEHRSNTVMQRAFVTQARQYLEKT